MDLLWFFSNVRTDPIQLKTSILIDAIVSITIGILASFWIDYGTHYIGGIRCAPDVPYTGGTASDRTFDPYTDVGPNGCTGQTTAAWRIPLSLQIVPAVILGIGMIFYPDSPRWLLMQERDEEAFKALSKLRRQSTDHPEVVAEVLDIKASIIVENTIMRDAHPGITGFKLHIAQVSLSTCLKFHETDHHHLNSTCLYSPRNPTSGVYLLVAAPCSSNNLWAAMP